MKTNPGPRPFGEPWQRVCPLVTSVSVEGVTEPAALRRQLRASGEDAGLAMLESCGPQLPTTRRSIVVARALLRVVLRGRQARVTALCPAAAPLLDRLSECLPGASASADGLRVPLPSGLAAAGVSDDERLRTPSALDLLRCLASQIADDEVGACLTPGLFGAFSYEFIDSFEALPPRRPDPLAEPDADFVLGTDFIVHDHRADRVQVVTRPAPGESQREAADRHAQQVAVVEGAATAAELPKLAVVEPATAVCDVSDDSFRQAVTGLLEHIYAGDVFQAVLSRGLTVRSSADPIAVYRALRQTNPSPYMFHFELEQGELLGASPETFLRVEQGEVEIRPIAGTAPRGRDEQGAIDPEFDDRLALSLLLDPKEQAEHAMLLDLARNDVARVAEAGSTRVVEQFAIEKYSQVQHLVSRVRGRLRHGLDALHAYRSAANMGTLTGAPKLRAMELIRAAEPTARGFYGGAAGYLLQDGSLDSCIVIRSLRYRDQVYSTRAGAGIVADSDPERELRETEQKSRACRIAVAMAEAGQT